MDEYERGYAQAVADRAAADLEQGKAELEHFYRTTCPCTYAEQWVHDCPKHGVKPRATPSSEDHRDG